MTARIVLLASSLLLLVTTGCASHSIVGTWQGRDDSAAGFTFGSVSFVADRTYTAEARYGDKIRVQSGTWSTRGDVLDLTAEGGARRYDFRVAEGELVVTDPATGQAMTFDRLVAPGR